MTAPCENPPRTVRSAGMPASAATSSSQDDARPYVFVNVSRGRIPISWTAYQCAPPGGSRSGPRGATPSSRRSGSSTSRSGKRSRRRLRGRGRGQAAPGVTHGRARQMAQCVGGHVRRTLAEWTFRFARLAVRQLLCQALEYHAEERVSPRRLREGAAVRQEAEARPALRGPGGSGRRRNREDRARRARRSPCRPRASSGLPVGRAGEPRGTRARTARR